MGLNLVPAGRDLPNDFNVVIEIPMNADPIKYEVDKESGAIFVDRFMGTAMHYPCNYGYVPHTIADDGDPVDVLVITPFPLLAGVVVRCRPIGVLKMQDESGGDAKVLAVPVDKVLPIYTHWQKPADMNVHIIMNVRIIRHRHRHRHRRNTKHPLLGLFAAEFTLLPNHSARTKILCAVFRL